MKYEKVSARRMRKKNPFQAKRIMHSRRRERTVKRFNMPSARVEWCWSGKPGSEAYRRALYILLSHVYNTFVLKTSEVF